MLAMFFTGPVGWGLLASAAAGGATGGGIYGLLGIERDVATEGTGWGSKHKNQLSGEEYYKQLKSTK